MDRHHVMFYLSELQSLMNKGDVSITINPHMDDVYTREHIAGIRNAVSEAINILSDQTRYSNTQGFIVRKLENNEMHLLDLRSDIRDCREAIAKVKRFVVCLVGIGVGILIACIKNHLGG